VRHNQHTIRKLKMEIMKVTAERQIAASIVVVLALAISVLPAHSQASTAESKPAVADLAVIVPSIEVVEQQNLASSRPYKITREYKAFGADGRHPAAEITAEISFAPPDKGSFTLTHVSGNSTVEKIVRGMLEQETLPPTAGHDSSISRANYDFVFVRAEHFTAVPEYVLHIIPKRKEKNLLLGLIWVDAKTFQIRRIEGVPAQSPSIWIKDIHMTLQQGDVNGMWLPVALDAIATVRFSGRYTLTGVDTVLPTSTVSTTSAQPSAQSDSLDPSR
jgi:hypothetical protein